MELFEIGRVRNKERRRYWSSGFSLLVLSHSHLCHLTFSPPVGKQNQSHSAVSRSRRPRPSTSVPTHTEEDLLLQRALLESILQLDEAQARQTIRQSSLQNSLSNIWRRTRHDLASRSALFYRLEMTQNPSYRSQQRNQQRPDDQLNETEREELLQRIYQYPVMFYCGMFFMFIGLCNALLFIPAFCLFITYGTLYPIIQLIAFLSISSSSSESNLLSIILTSVYLFFLGLLLLLAPLVSQFQLFRTDIVDLKEFPIEFYQPVVVKEIHRRFNAELDRRHFEDFIIGKLGHDMLRYIQEYVEDYPRVWK